jgi:flagellar basal-body rod modification protein FlgD
MASAVSALTGSSASTGAASSSSSSSLASAPSEEVFLQLLVAQLQNQDPLNPTDSTQFVSQLAQFSELEQVIGIRSDIESYTASAPASQTSASSTPSTAQTQTQP